MCCIIIPKHFITGVNKSFRMQTRWLALEPVLSCLPFSGPAAGPSHEARHHVCYLFKVSIDELFWRFPWQKKADERVALSCYCSIHPISAADPVSCKLPPKCCESNAHLRPRQKATLESIGHQGTRGLSYYWRPFLMCTGTHLASSCSMSSIRFQAFPKCAWPLSACTSGCSGISQWPTWRNRTR